MRNFIIGDEWLYYKIYASSRTIDAILTNTITPLMNKFLTEGLIDLWFFIRYADPHNHLRVRVRLKDLKNISEVISLFRSSTSDYLKYDFIWKMQIDTYSRELERYGTNTMDLSEKIFFYDSQMIINFLSTTISNESFEDIRWLFAIKSIDSFFEIFQYTNEQKLLALKILRDGYAEEFKMSRQLKKQLDLKYRNKTVIIEKFLSDTNHQDINQLLEIRRYKIRPVADQILDIDLENKLEIHLNNLIFSYVHMSLNRLFKSKFRLHELVCYDFLYRYYKSINARNNISA